MAVILAEILILMALLRKQKNAHRHALLCLAFLIQFTLLIAYRLELSFLWHRTVYWSDAEYYWTQTLDLLNGVPISAYNLTYVYYSYLVQLTSPFRTPLLNNISNVLLMNLSFFLGIEIVKQNNHKLRLPWIIYMTSIGNPLVTYSLMRNLKDSLFLFLTVSSIYTIIQLLRMRPFLRYLILPLWTYLFLMLLNNIRPWGFLIVLSNVALLLLMERRRIYKLTNLLILLALLFGLFQAGRYVDITKAWLAQREILIEYGTGHSQLNPLTVPLGIFRIIMGPGPIRSLFGHEYFLYYTYVGLIASFIGSILWWFLFPALLGKVLSSPGKLIRGNVVYLSSILLLFILIYSYFYGGSTELRFRGTLYILISLVAVPIMISRERVTWKLFSGLTGYCLLLAFLVIPAIIFSV